MKLEAISSPPVTCYLSEETNFYLSTASFQVAVEREGLPSAFFSPG